MTAPAAIFSLVTLFAVKWVALIVFAAIRSPVMVFPAIRSPVMVPAAIKSPVIVFAAIRSPTMLPEAITLLATRLNWFQCSPSQVSTSTTSDSNGTSTLGELSGSPSA